jgi:hypothetical protein
MPAKACKARREDGRGREGGEGGREGGKQQGIGDAVGVVRMET